MGKDTDPTKPIPNDEKFKPQNVKDPLKNKAPGSGRGAPGDTEGDDVAQGSRPVTNKRPSK